jgi:hypothetical protein
VAGLRDALNAELGAALNVAAPPQLLRSGRRRAGAAAAPPPDALDELIARAGAQADSDEEEVE